MPQLAQSSATTEIAEWLAARVADYLCLDPADVTPTVPLAEYGLDSVLAGALCGDIEDRFAILVDPTLAFDYPTVELIAEFLAAETAQGAGRVARRGAR
jgi:acyl carrier protein